MLLEDLDAVVELERKLAEAKAPTSIRVRVPPAMRPIIGSATWEQFADLVHGSQIVALRLIEKNGQEATALEDLATELGVRGNQEAGGVVSAIRRNAKKAGLDPDEVIVRIRDGRYIPGPLLNRFGAPRPTIYDHVLHNAEADDD
ncbi:MAG: hypothetical protein AB7K71_29115 [Polyangiaceae bacterium]